MGNLGPESVEAIIAACGAGVTEAAEGLSRALDAPFAVSAPIPVEHFYPQSPPDAWSGGGLILVITSPAGSAAMVVTSGAGLLPEWCIRPDATGRSRLSTLAQELGAALLPAEFFPDQAGARWTND